MIAIRTKFRPFSHMIGVSCIIPGTDAIITAFPDRLKIDGLEIGLDHPPFVDGFTLQQDLERSCVWVFAKSFRLKIVPSSGGIQLISDGKTLFFPHIYQTKFATSIEKLSLGSHKSQDWDMILRRFDWKEMAPILYRIAQTVPGSASPIKGDLSVFYRTSFQSMGVPQNKDMSLLQSLFQTLRSYFFLEDRGDFLILPNNPFPEGRLLQIQTEMGFLDIEWASRKLKRAFFFPSKTGQIVLRLPKEIVSFRLKKSLRCRGVSHLVRDPIPVIEGSPIYLDRFFT
jgi:hypothetical protein